MTVCVNEYVLAKYVANKLKQFISTFFVNQVTSPLTCSKPLNPPVKLNRRKNRCHFQAFDLDTCYADAVGFPDPVECADAAAPQSSLLWRISYCYELDLLSEGKLPL
jgi:hypothetical protein